MLLKLLRLNANHITRNAINRHDALFMIQELGGGWTIRHDPEEHPRPDEVQQADDEEDELPGFDMRRMRVTEAVPEERTDHGRHAVESEEYAHANGLFVAAVKHADYVHDGGTDTGFEHAEEEAEG